MTLRVKVKAFKVDEAGDPALGFVAVAFLGLCAWGPTRALAWDVLCRYVREASVRA